MFNLPQPMLAQTRIVYESTRATSLGGWWAWALLLVAFAVVVYACVRMYRRDAGELNPWVRRVLIGLRLTILVGLVVLFLDITRRTQRLLHRPSEAVILVDGSQSMTLPETLAETQSGASSGGGRRIDRANRLLSETDLIKRLGATHRVSVYEFGRDSTPTLIQTVDSSGVANAADGAGSIDAAGDTASASWPRRLAWLGLAAAAAGLTASLASLIVGATSRRSSGHATVTPRSVAMLLAIAAVLLPVGIAGLGAAASIRSQTPLWSLLTGADDQDGTPNDDSTDSIDADAAGREIANPSDIDVVAKADQSRIGDAIRAVLGSHDAATLSGVVVLTDGQNNGGVSLDRAVAAARRDEVAIVPVGLGDVDAPLSVRIVDLDVPRRVYPGDKFVATATIQISGAPSRGNEIEAQLFDELDRTRRETTPPNRGSNANNPGGDRSDGDGAGDSGANVGDDVGIELPEQLIETQSVDVDGDSTLRTVRFEIEPDQVGRRRLAVRVSGGSGEAGGIDVRDARYEVVADKLKVLVVAGGPTREYRFVRNLLYRDPSTELDVWLQTGRPGISQDADQLLASMPSTPAELFDYDAVLMFDPDWTSIDAAALDLLDRYVSVQAGGLMVVAGPVYHPEWVRRRTDPRTAVIAGFYPVTFSSGSTRLLSGRQGGSRPWPLQLTPEAPRADFMRLSDDPSAAGGAWENFDGVYDFVSVREPKPGAKTYAYFSDPTTEIGGRLPVFMASQFYGAGRTFFLGSGELWRIRGLDESYFDRFYTKLVRWAAQGRLLRESNRGVLLVDNPRAMLGDTINIRAVLVDEQFEPLVAPSVEAQVLTPEGGVDTVTLRAVQGAGRDGAFDGSYVVRQAGDYEIRVTLGDALDEVVLATPVQVRLPTIELERPRRNDGGLQTLAVATGGEYLPVDAKVSDQTIIDRLSEQLVPRDQTTVLPGTPDRTFSLRRNATLLWLIATMLSMEWVIRRLHRLA